MLTYGSLFSGYGGLDMGVQSVLGGRTLWHCEYDAAPSRILDTAAHDPRYDQALRHLRPGVHATQDQARPCADMRARVQVAPALNPQRRAEGVMNVPAQAAAATRMWLAYHRQGAAA